MQYYTSPEPNPKPAVPAREDALDLGRLIDLDELLGRYRLPLPAALTDSLLDLIEEVPFSEVGSSSEGERLERVVNGAGKALERAEAHYGRHFAAALRHGFVLDFSVPLRARSCEKPYRFVRMHCGPDDLGEVVITLALPVEF